MSFKIGSFPFTYLGILITPKKLAISHFESVITRIEKLIANWKNLHLSPVGKAILINSSIMSIPLYYLSVYPIPDTILDHFSKVARKFFLSRSGNRNGMNSVA